jgi:hypothetical protein
LICQTSSGTIRLFWRIKLLFSTLLSIFNSAVLTISNSQKTKTGFLNTRDSLLVFINSNDTVFPQKDVQNLIKELKGYLAGKALTPLQRTQFKIQLDWLQRGSVPQGEFIVKSMGLINPADNTNYMVLVSGLMVSDILWNETGRETRHLAPT